MNILPRVVEHTPQGNVGFSRNKKSIVHVVGSQSRKWATSQGLRQYFQYSEYSFHGHRLKIKNFLHSKALRFYLEGSGFFLVLYLRRKGEFEIGFLPVGFHKIRRATGF